MALIEEPCFALRADDVGRCAFQRDHGLQARSSLTGAAEKIGDHRTTRDAEQRCHLAGMGRDHHPATLAAERVRDLGQAGQGAGVEHECRPVSALEEDRSEISRGFFVDNRELKVRKNRSCFRWATIRSARLRQLRIKQGHTPNEAPSGCLMLLPL